MRIPDKLIRTCLKLGEKKGLPKSGKKVYSIFKDLIKLEKLIR